MISIQTKLKVIDNSGAKEAQCIRVYKKPTAHLGDFILITVKKVKQKQKTKLSIKRGTVLKAIVVNTVFKRKNRSNVYFSFDSNSIVLLNQKNNQPIGTRILGPVSMELRHLRQCKLLSIGATFI